MDEIAAGKGRKRVWHSNRPAGDAAKDPPQQSGRPQSQREFKAQLKALASARKAPAGKKASAEQIGRAREGKARGKIARARETGRGQSCTQERAGVGTAACRLSFRRASLRCTTTAPSGKNWLHEIKFDGYRIEARLDHGKVQLLTRKQLDWTHRFKPIARGGQGSCRRKPR